MQTVLYKDFEGKQTKLFLQNSCLQNDNLHFARKHKTKTMDVNCSRKNDKEIEKRQKAYDMQEKSTPIQ